MIQELRQMSPAGWKMTISWTVVGTLCCVIFSVCFNAIVLRDFNGFEYRRGMIVAIVQPILMAGPLFFFLTLKLRELSRLNHRLNNAVSVDHLTGVLNRGAFTDAAKAAIKLLGRGGRPSGKTNLFLVIDIDHFKSVNDRYGHPVGDKAIQCVADAMTTTIRDQDLMGRLGGEEFGMLITHVSEEDAPLIAERVRRSVSSICMVHNSVPIELSVSVGGVVFSSATEFNALYKAADTKLYEAKKAGRNASILTCFNAYCSELSKSKREQEADLLRIEPIHGQAIGQT